MKHGIYIDRIEGDKVWITYYHEGKAIWEQRLAQTFRDYFDSKHGEPNTANRADRCFDKLRFDGILSKELKIA
jgi:hypothetical protein